MRVDSGCCYRFEASFFRILLAAGLTMYHGRPVWELDVDQGGAVMPRPRIHVSPAARQAAYRVRREQARQQGEGVVPMTLALAKQTPTLSTGLDIAIRRPTYQVEARDDRPTRLMDQIVWVIAEQVSVQSSVVPIGEETGPEASFAGLDLSTFEAEVGSLHEISERRLSTVLRSSAWDVPED
jgi:hypothetical protein